MATRPLTQVERLLQYHKLGEHNTTGLGAVDYNPVLEGIAFVQKNKGSSNDDIPH